MTIDINPALAVDLSSILQKPAEEKAKQLPEPKTFHLLCVVPEAMEEYQESDVGILKDAKTMHYEEVLTPVLFVVKVGPTPTKTPPASPAARLASKVTSSSCAPIQAPA